MARTFLRAVLRVDGRALGGVEGLPVAEEGAGMGAARMQVGLQRQERVADRADLLRHPRQVDIVEVEARIGGQPVEDAAPQRAEALGVERGGEVAGEHRRVVVAHVRGQPGQPLEAAGRFDRQGEEEQRPAVAGFAGDDGGHRAGRGRRHGSARRKSSHRSGRRCSRHRPRASARSRRRRRDRRGRRSTGGQSGAGGRGAGCGRRRRPAGESVSASEVNRVPRSSTDS